MLLTMFQKAVLYIKEIQDIGLFAAMANSLVYQLLIASSIYFAMLPLLGLLMTVLALIEAYQLAKASNRNLDKWLSFIVATLCAVCASVSLYGTAASLILGFSFAAGPWFFLSSLLIGLTHQLFMLGLNAYRAYESRQDPIQRMHYIQAVWQHVFITGLVTAITGAVVFLLLTPVAPLVGAICALTAITFTGLNMLWRLIPHGWKQVIKGHLNLAKPEIREQSPEMNESPKLEKDIQLKVDKEVVHQQRIFSHCDYSAEVKARDLESADRYLRDIICHKIERLNLAPLNEKNNQRKASLADVLWILDMEAPISKKALLKQYPQAFQSFWAEKDEVEQIIDAVLVFQEKHQEKMTLKAEVAVVSNSCA